VTIACDSALGEAEARDCPAHRTALVLMKQAVASLKRPVLVGIGGPGGSGKSTFSESLARHFGEARVLPLDDYRKPRHERPRGIYGSHPDGNRLDLLRSHLESARRGEDFLRPVFCRERGAAFDGELVTTAPVVIADGEIAAHRDLRHEFDLRIVILTDWTLQWRARMGRDRTQRGCDLSKALSLFVRSNLRDYPRFAAGSTRDAHLVLRRGRSGSLESRAVRA
jgi:uridine kinase